MVLGHSGPFWLFNTATDFCVRLASRAIVVYGGAKNLFLYLLLFSGSNFMGGKFWSLLEILCYISLDTYIHHLQLNWIT